MRRSNYQEKNSIFVYHDKEQGFLIRTHSKALRANLN